jgi:hypothetical protein
MVQVIHLAMEGIRSDVIKPDDGQIKRIKIICYEVR